MAEAGITSIRLFPEWRQLEPTKGTWKWDDSDRLVKTAADNHLEITAILMGSSHNAKGGHTFPMDDLEGWANYVTNVVGRYKDKIRYWEVWNEGNGGFNDGHHTTADYARLAEVTYAAAKKANPQAQVGLSVASFDAPYLNQAILAMKKDGKPNSFDFLCIHPYEIADGLGDVDGEIPFLWMTHGLRAMLKESAPEKADCPIWITEVSRRIEKKKGGEVTEADAARAVVKLYTMALAQGIARVQWFEGQDPIGEDQGFGLIARNGTPRASYQSMKTMTTFLGSEPEYLGWLDMGVTNRGYGFVFNGKMGPVLVTWMPKGWKGEVIFDEEVEITDAISGVKQTLKRKEVLTLTDVPVFVVGLGAESVELAKKKAKKSFPWGRNYSQAKTVSLKLGTAAFPREILCDGITQAGRANRPVVLFADGSYGEVLEGDIEHGISFYVHPSFATFQTHDYYVRVTVRRLGPGNVGMNLLYEVADSKGQGPYKNTGIWGGTKPDDGWQTITWHVTDACFSRMWGNDFTIRPEQSIPFALGKVEVSTEPFK
jgi:hypothetical protein